MVEMYLELLDDEVHEIEAIAQINMSQADSEQVLQKVAVFVQKHLAHGFTHIKA